MTGLFRSESNARRKEATTTEARYDMVDYNFEDYDLEPLPFVNRLTKKGITDDSLLAEEIDHLSMEERVKAVNDLRVVEYKDSEKILAKNLIQVPLDQREFGLHELHGVSDVIEETPELIERCLFDLETGIQKIPKKAAYDQAKATAPESVDCRKFRLMFLRAERFDANNAAARLVKYFEGKLKLFGADKLTKIITMEDLDEDDLATLKSGYLQLLPERDRAGRAIIVLIVCLGQCRSVENMMRAFWYVTTTSLEDEETQKLGMVFIAINIEPTAMADRFKAVQGGYLSRTIPMRLVAVHFCVSQPIQRLSATLATMVLGVQLQLRTRVHYGSIVEIQYTLMTFGVPTRVLPVTSAGEYKLGNHMEWLAKRKQLEGAMDGTERVIVPSPFDVLVGRGRFIQEHAGNLRYRHIIESHMERYEYATKRAEKTDLTAEVVTVVNERGGRFLKQDGGGWIEIDADCARDKVSHSFRNLRKTMGTTSTNKSASKGSICVRSECANESENGVDSKKIRLVSPAISENDCAKEN